MKSLPPHCPPRALQSGFTLIELLVTMALLSLLMLGMASALRTMAQTEERVDGRLARSDELRVTTGFIRTILGRVSARKTVAPMKEGVSPYLFTGAADAVAWVGVMPARYGAGGRYFFRLAVESVEGVSALVIRFTPWSDTTAFPDWDTADSRVLARDVTHFALSYEDARQPVPTWVTAWQRVDTLPERIQIELVTSAGAWPLCVVAMRSLPASERGSGRFSAGPE